MTNPTPAARKAAIAHARKIDTEVARLWTEFHKVNDPAIAKRREAAQIERRLRSYVPTESIRANRVATIERLRAEADAIAIEAAPLRQAAVDYDAAEYKGWNRFFLVQHIHNTQHCSSFRPTTRVGWLPDVSGLTEAEAVAAHGETLCTICFPSAPVALTVKPVDESVCPGSGKLYDADKLTGRERAYYSPAGTCSVCGERVGLTARYSAKVRKHKRPA